MEENTKMHTHITLTNPETGEIVYDTDADAVFCFFHGINPDQNEIHGFDFCCCGPDPLAQVLANASMAIENDINENPLVGMFVKAIISNAKGTSEEEKPKDFFSALMACLGGDEEENEEGADEE